MGDYGELAFLKLKSVCIIKIIHTMKSIFKVF